MNTCKLCNGDFDFRKVQISECLGETKILFSPNLNKVSEDERFKYCPLCGRKLTADDFVRKHK